MFSRGISLTFSRIFRARWGWFVSPKPLPPLPPWITPYSLSKGLGGQQGQSGRAENLVPNGIWSTDRPPRAQSLYRLIYPAHRLSSNRCILRLLLSQSCLLNTTFWQINFLSTSSPSLPICYSSRCCTLHVLYIVKKGQGSYSSKLVLFWLFCCYLCCYVFICVVL
jgi:hypothetical protein